MGFIKTMSYYTNASEWLEISRMTSTSFETHASTQGDCDGMGLGDPHTLIEIFTSLILIVPSHRCRMVCMRRGARACGVW